MHSVAGWGLDALIEKDKDGGVHFWGETVEGGQLIDWEQSSQTRLPNGLLNSLCCAVQADEITNSGNKDSPRQTPKFFKAGGRMLHDYECP